MSAPGTGSIVQKASEDEKFKELLETCEWVQLIQQSQVGGTKVLDPNLIGYVQENFLEMCVTSNYDQNSWNNIGEDQYVICKLDRN